MFASCVIKVLKSYTIIYYEVIALFKLGLIGTNLGSRRDRMVDEFSNSVHGEVDSIQTLYDKVCRRLATGRWFSPDTPISSTNKTVPDDITKIRRGSRGRPPPP